MLGNTAKVFLSALKVSSVESGTWLRGCCPLAPFTHKHGKDSDPSFGISLKEGKSSFNCFSCHSGSLEELIQSLEMYSRGTDYQDYYDFITARKCLDEENILLPLPEFKEFTNTDYDKFVAWPENSLDVFIPWKESKKAIEYLEKRLVLPKTADFFSLLVDERYNRIVFPYYNIYGKLAGCRGRSFGTGLRHLEYVYDAEFSRVAFPHNPVSANLLNNSRLVWFNEHNFKVNKPVIIVEGQFDLLKIWPLYENVLAVLSAKPTIFKLQKLLQAHSVLLMLDSDTAGGLAIEKLSDFLIRNGIKVGVVPLQEDKKDPDECDISWISQTLKDDLILKI